MNQTKHQRYKNGFIPAGHSRIRIPGFFYMLAMFCVIILAATPPQGAMAQQAERELLPFNSDHYECFMTIECITNNQELVDRGWRFAFDKTTTRNPQELTATMKGKNISLSASYNKEGKLVRATYKRQNLALPPALLVHLHKKYNGWKMVGNEKVVKNFECNSTVYSVTMQNGNSITKLRFNQADVDEFIYET